MLAHRLIPLFLTSASLCAQSFAVPPGTDPAIGTCNAFPFSTSDMRYQALVRATELGNTAGVISGLAFSPCTTGVRTMRAITVKLAHYSTLNGGVMTTTFSSNLNSPGPAQTVLDTVNHQWQTVANTWNSIGLQDPFFYNGTDDLVVEVLVLGSSGTSGTTHRDATNQRVYLGGYGQLAGTNGGNTAFKLKFYFGDANAQLFGAGCAGTAGPRRSPSPAPRSSIRSSTSSATTRPLQYRCIPHGHEQQVACVSARSRLGLHAVSRRPLRRGLVHQPRRERGTDPVRARRPKRCRIRALRLGAGSRFRGEPRRVHDDELRSRADRQLSSVRLDTPRA